MAIRSEKKKVVQQIVNNDNSGLDFDPKSLLGSGEIHWSDVTAGKSPTPAKKEDPAPPGQESKKEER